MAAFINRLHKVTNPMFFFLKVPGTWYRGCSQKYRGLSLLKNEHIDEYTQGHEATLASIDSSESQLGTGDALKSTGGYPYLKMDI